MEFIVPHVHVVMVITIVVVALASSFIINASDPSPLQNICVADNKASVHVNGKVCKDPKLVTVDDFLYSGLQIPANTNNREGFGVKPVFVDQLPGLNTLGISISRGHIAIGGSTPLHFHPRVSEIMLVLEGTLLSGFLDSTPGTKTRFFSKILKPGDVFVIPTGLLHFTQNVGNTSSSYLASYNSQNFGFVKIGVDVFSTQPPLPADILAKSFQLDIKTVEHLQSLAW